MSSPQLSPISATLSQPSSDAFQTCYRSCGALSISRLRGSAIRSSRSRRLCARISLMTTSKRSPMAWPQRQPSSKWHRACSLTAKESLGCARRSAFIAATTRSPWSKCIVQLLLVVLGVLGRVRVEEDRQDLRGARPELDRLAGARLGDAPELGVLER